MEMYRWLVTALLLLALSAVWAEENPLDQEQRLRQPVTVQQKMILLPDLLRAIGKQTGVNLTCGRELANDKLTVFVREKPAVEVLNHVATLMMGEWRRTKEGYSLSQTAQAQRWEEELLALELEQARRETQQYIEGRLMRDAGRDYLQWMRETEEARKQIFGQGGPRIRTPEGNEIPIAPGSVPMLYPGAMPPRISDYLAGWLFRQFRQEHWKAFWQGQTFIASTLDLPGAWRLPPEAVQWARESVVPVFSLDDELTQQYLRSERERSASTTGIIIAVQYAPPSGLRVAMWRITPDGFLPDPRFVGPGAMPTRGEEHPLLSYWKGWQTPEAEAGKISLLKTPLRLPLTSHLSYIQTIGALSAFKPVTLADRLEELVKGGGEGVQVIADAYRCSWAPSTVSPAGAKSVGEWLKAMFVRSIQSQPPGWWRVEGDYLLIKHYGHWLLRRTELPEQRVRALEAKAEKGQQLTLDDYASVASSMGILHELRMWIRPYTLRFDPNPLIEYSFFRLWAGLNAGQRAQLLRNGFLPIETLTPQQQALLWNYVGQSLFLRPAGRSASLERGARDRSLPAATLQMQYRQGENYELISEHAWFENNNLQSARETAARMFAEGTIEPGYRIQGFYVSTYTLSMALAPNLQWSAQISIRRPMPATEEKE